MRSLCNKQHETFCNFYPNLDQIKTSEIHKQICLESSNSLTKICPCYVEQLFMQIVDAFYKLCRPEADLSNVFTRRLRDYDALDQRKYRWIRCLGNLFFMLWLLFGFRVATAGFSLDLDHCVEYRSYFQYYTKAQLSVIVIVCGDIRPCSC